MNPLIQKLEQFQELSDDEKKLLDSAVTKVIEFEPRQDIISDGDRPECVHLLLHGWAARYNLLPSGERQIMAFMIPGDLCDIHIAMLNRMDHSIGALSHCRVGLITRQTIEDILREHRGLSRALFWDTLVDQAILREWLVNNGRRPSDKRTGHFICEMLLRLRAIGLSGTDSFEMPLTQNELADAMSMSTVHMNRTLQDLRSNGFIATEGKRIVITDVEKLMEFSDFDPAYLHQDAHRKR